MSVEEIVDWMAYETSLTPEFKERLRTMPAKLDPSQEAEAIRNIFSSLGQPAK